MAGNLSNLRNRYAAIAVLPVVAPPTNQLGLWQQPPIEPTDEPPGD